MKVAYTNASPDGRFQFHAADGTENVVDSGRYVTDDPGVIAYLDATPSVKRVSDKGKDGEG